MFRSIARVATAALALATALPALAGGVTLDGRVFVERASPGRNGERMTLMPATRLQRGDRVIYLLAWRNIGDRPAREVVVTNPLPDQIAFQSAGRRGIWVSVDGGRQWGPLGSLSVRDEDGGLRGARPEDVTHLRWRFAQAIPAGASGRLSFRGVVR